MSTEYVCPNCLGDDDDCPRCTGNGTLSYPDEPDTRGADWREVNEQQARTQREQKR